MVKRRVTRKKPNGRRGRVAKRSVRRGRKLKQFSSDASMSSTASIAQVARAAARVAGLRTRKRVRSSSFSGDTSGERGDGGITTGEVSFLKRHMGRPMRHNLRNAWKEIESTTTPVYYRYQGASPWSNATGFYNLDRAVTSTPPSAGSLQNMPLYLLELTGVPDNGGQGSVYTPFYQLQAQYDGTTTNTNYGWRSTVLSDVVPSTGASAVGPNWEVENSSHTLVGATNNPGVMDIMSYADIRMICVGATTTPTKFEISICQLTQDWLVPGVTVTNTINAQGNWVLHKNRVWESEVWPYITSPIMPQPPRSSGRFIKRLHTVSFTLQSKTSIEQSNEGHFKVVKMFKWFNRRQRYDWNKFGTNGGVTSVGTVPLSYQTEDVSAPNALLSQTVTPRARIFLMIKATNQTPGAAAVTSTPSFDLIVRKKHVQSG